MPGRAPTSGWRGPLRLALAIFAAGVLVVWLITPIGNACPDLGTLPHGSTASSSPSFSPPLTRTCTYVTAGVKATARYVPVLDWIVLLLLAAVAAGIANALSPARRRGTAGSGRVAREPRPAREPYPAQARRPARPGPSTGAARGSREEGMARASEPGAPRPEAPPDPQPRPSRGRAPREPPVAGATERDAAEREQARRERAERARRGR